MGLARRRIRKTQGLGAEPGQRQRGSGPAQEGGDDKIGDKRSRVLEWPGTMMSSAGALAKDRVGGRAPFSFCVGTLMSRSGPQSDGLRADVSAKWRVRSRHRRNECEAWCCAGRLAEGSMCVGAEDLLAGPLAAGMTACSSGLLVSATARRQDDEDDKTTRPTPRSDRATCGR